MANLNFTDVMRKSVSFWGELDAVRMDGVGQTYAELGERARRIANGLIGLGLAKGDRVATLEDNRLDSHEKVVALAIGGFVRCPMYTLNVASTHAFMLNLVGARAVMVEAKYLDQIESVRHQLPELAHIIVVGGPAPEGTLSYEELIAGASDEWPDVEVGLDDNHIIRFSAGTTGRPKGILHTVDGWQGMTNEWNQCYPRFEPGDGFLVAAPLSHASGLGIWSYLSRGAHMVVMSSFDPAKFIETAEREKVVGFLAVPTMLQMMTQVPGVADRDLSRIRIIQYGASPISPTLLRACLAIFGNVFYQAFGQSECLPATILQPEYHRTSGSDEDNRMLTSVGRATPNVVITICDEDGVELPDGEVGEICTRSPGAMKEIWGDPEATAERILPDGSVRSRDMGYRDPDGFIHIVDRKEDLIITGGYNVWPLEVENALAEHADVSEAIVVGVPDVKWGEQVIAVIHTTEGSTTTPEEFKAFCKEKLGSVKTPKTVFLTQDMLPRSPVGKLLRRAAREQYWKAPSDG